MEGFLKWTYYEPGQPGNQENRENLENRGSRENWENFENRENRENRGNRENRENLKQINCERVHTVNPLWKDSLSESIMKGFTQLIHHERIP